jgi:hypothetical protein
MTPISQLSATDWRVLIGQNIGLPILVPLALEVLEQNPLVETEHFRGDLLDAVLRASPQYYQERPDIRSRVDALASSMRSALEDFDHVDFDVSLEALEEAVTQFRQGQK